MTHIPVPTRCLIVPAVLLASWGVTHADDWPQWRGPNRDAKVTGFTAPKTWPKELTRKWNVKVGEGVATPALVGDKLYVIARQDGKEIVRALDAATGKEVWKDEYETPAVRGAAQEFSGPRSSPTVSDGKIVTFGTNGVLSVYDTMGKRLWRKEDFKGAGPRFATSSSPIVVDGLVIAQVGGEAKGGIIAYDLATGEERWKWTDDGTAYASPSLLTIDGAKVIVAETDRQIVAIGAGDAKLLWKTPYAVGGGDPKGGAKGGGKGGKGGGRGYNASTPMVEGQTLIYSGSGRGTKAVKLEKKGNELAATELWHNTENSVQFNTPVLKDGMVFGLSAQNNLFCITKDGKTAWTAPIRGRGRPGYGSIVDVGPVLLALTPAAELIVFEPSDKGYKDFATYKVSTSDTHAYPVVSGNRVYIKDQDSVTLWTIE